jgi:hypothetical protein
MDPAPSAAAAVCRMNERREQPSTTVASHGNVPLQGPGLRAEVGTAKFSVPQRSASTGAWAWTQLPPLAAQAGYTPGARPSSAAATLQAASHAATPATWRVRAGTDQPRFGNRSMGATCSIRTCSPAMNLRGVPWARQRPGGRCQARRRCVERSRIGGDGGLWFWRPPHLALGLLICAALSSAHGVQAPVADSQSAGDAPAGAGWRHREFTGLLVEGRCGAASRDPGRDASAPQNGCGTPLRVSLRIWRMADFSPAAR